MIFIEALYSVVMQGWWLLEDMASIHHPVPPGDNCHGHCRSCHSLQVRNNPALTRKIVNIIIMFSVIFFLIVSSSYVHVLPIFYMTLPVLKFNLHAQHYAIHASLIRQHYRINIRGVTIARTMCARFCSTCCL